MSTRDQESTATGSECATNGTELEVEDFEFVGEGLMRIISCQVKPGHRSLPSFTSATTEMMLDLRNRELTYGERKHSVKFSGIPTEGPTQSYIRDGSVGDNISMMRMIIKQSPTMLGTEDGTESTTASKSWQGLIDESQDYENENEECRRSQKAAEWEAGEFGSGRQGRQAKTGTESTGKGTSVVDDSKQLKFKTLVSTVTP